MELDEAVKKGLIESSPYIEMNLLGREILKKLDICFYRMNKICNGEEIPMMQKLTKVMLTIPYYV
jgi:hypothetical protein